MWYSMFISPIHLQNAPFFFTLFLFSVLASCGLAGAGSLLWALLSPGGRRRLHRRLPVFPVDVGGGGAGHGDPVAFARFARAALLNVCVVCLLQLLLLLPASLFVLLVHNWVLGSFLCYALTMIQVREKERGPIILQEDLDF